MALPVIKRYFPLAGSGDVEGINHVQWCLEFKKRNNDKITKQPYVNWVMETVDATKTSISYDFADVEVIIEVFRDMLIMAVVPGYKRDFKKYNLQTLAGIKDANGNDSDAERPTVNVAELIKRKKEAAAAAAAEENKPA